MRQPAQMIAVWVGDDDRMDLFDAEERKVRIEYSRTGIKGVCSGARINQHRLSRRRSDECCITLPHIEKDDFHRSFH